MFDRELARKISILPFFYCPYKDLIIINPFWQKWISNGNRTECSPVRSVIIQVITKSDDRAGGVRLVSHEYDYRPNWTTRSLITEVLLLILTITISEKKRIAKLWKKGKLCIKILTMEKYFVSIDTLKWRLVDLTTALNVIGWFKLHLWMWLAYWTVR